MKTKKNLSRLVLRKETISALNEESLNSAQGGTGYHTFVSKCPCPGYYTGFDFCVETGLSYCADC